MKCPSCKNPLREKGAKVTSPLWSAALEVIAAYKEKEARPPTGNPPNV
jgi:hypothetical protein